MRRKLTLLIIVLSAFCYTGFAQLTCGINASVTSGCPPLNVVFTDNSTGTGGSCTHFWDPDLGGNNTGTASSHNVAFTQPGIYNVKHVIRCGGQADSCVIQIQVFQPPTVNFVSADNKGCIYPCHTVNLSNQTTPGSAAVTEYVWDYGDGNPPQSVTPPMSNSQHCYDSVGSYQVTLIARDANGCQTSRIRPNFVVIGNFPTITSSATPTVSCNAPLTVTFTASATSTNGATNCAWYFGDGGTSAQCNILRTYLTGGIYDAMLLVTDTLGCQDTAFHRISVTDVNADFSVWPSTNACRGLPVQFSDSSDFATQWQWDFGDGTNSNQKNPTKTYNANGTYNVRLIARYNTCADTIVRNAYITVTDPVTYTTTVSDTANCSAPFTVNFTATPTGGGTPTAYNWSFGDGTSSNLQNPSHTYTADGTYTVTVSVTSPGGCINSQILSSRISIGVTNASFTIDSDAGCRPLTVRFTNTTSSTIAISSYRWDFGDGNTSTQANPVHIYTAAGQFKPILIVTDAAGCIDTFEYPDVVRVGNTLFPAFIASPVEQCVNKTITFTNNTQGSGPGTTWLWDFGDGSTSTLRNPTHEYSDTGYFTVTLTVINDGCPNDTVRVRYIHIVPPRADFQFDLDCNSVLDVQFRDSSVGAETWYWDFGDGTFSTDTNPFHQFTQQGVYDVTLIVSNSITGCVDSATRKVQVGNPAAQFFADTTFGCFPLRVTFADSSLYASGWYWDFGVPGVTDDTSTLQNPRYTYRDTGLYTVTLVINPGNNCSDTIRRVNYIRVNGVFPHISLNPTQGCSPLLVNFRSDSSLSYNGNIIAWSWAFGDGDSSILPNPSHIYNTTVPSVGYTVRLTVTDNNRCRAARSFVQVRVVSPVADFFGDTLKCVGEAVSFTSTSVGTQGAPRTIWDFGDGSQTLATNANTVTHSYTQTGSYSVTLVAIHQATGCRDTLVRTAFVSIDTPEVDFTVDATFKPCPPFPVQFTNTSNRDDLNWVWIFGDGGTGTTKDPLHVYFFPGDYDVTLIGWDSTGCSDTIFYPKLISVRGPIGNFTATTDSGCTPLTITISGTVKSTVDIIADLGDGTQYLDTIELTHTYVHSPSAGAFSTFYPVYTLTDSLGCKVAYPVDTFIVGIIPDANLPADTTVCRGNYIQFDLPDYVDYAFWEANLPNKYLSCDTCVEPLSTAPDTITYYVTTSTNIGCTARDTVLMNVDALPQIFPGIQFRICRQDTLQLNAGPNVTTATWTPNLYISDTTSPSPKVWPPDSMTYRVTGVNNTGCSISRIVRVAIIDSVKADLNINDTLLCEGGTVQLNVVVREASFNDTSFLWMPSRYLSGNTIPNPVFSAPHGEYDFTVIIGSPKCVADTEDIHIVVSPRPSLEAGDDQTVAEGTQVQLWAASPNPVNYVWTPVIDSFSCTNCRRPFVNVTANQVVYVRASNEWGCEAIDSVVLRVVSCDPESVFVPNTFTPNGDGLNDVLYVRGIGLRQLDYFRIFDRWGVLVFETKNINEGWDGTYGSKKADLATYVYLMKGVCSSGQSMEMSGNVTLIR